MAAMWGDDRSLGDARTWLRTQAQTAGSRCPCCTQFTKVYRRSISSGTARGLIKMWNAGGRAHFQPIYLPALAARLGGEAARLRYWELIIEEQVERDDGGRAGWWRVTEQGAEFVAGQATTPKYAYVFDGRCLKLDGPPVSIRDCLGNRFNLEELMALDAPVEGDIL